ncbi:uncharacterized protein LOC107882553 [Acyrthosiphon pisum]|uniref:Uncharacterized protein n=1 Tax=Acyrthosiphon pisum TaxID=7029 RepID=A0A8R2D1R8_ACYPI|nr:uncharacterized protein LOC107882553 [Acyrthosiphon pisum]|eukprot:XP_016656557.1 PREDICTED: uncharacterized protein LOC107882553 isoform X1 [Acyrthosiphon pisum]
MCKHLKDARNVFNGLEALALYVHFSKRAKDHKLKNMQNKLGLKNTKLEQLSDTRWVCRFKSCNALIQNYKSILMTLDDEILEQKSKYVAQAIDSSVHTYIEYSASVKRNNSGPIG